MFKTILLKTVLWSSNFKSFSREKKTFLEVLWTCTEVLHNDKQYNDNEDNYTHHGWYAALPSIVMLDVIWLNVVVVSVIMTSIIILSVVMLGAIKLQALMLTLMMSSIILSVVMLGAMLANIRLAWKIATDKH